MTIDQHLRTIAGSLLSDLVIRIAAQAAEIDTLREQLTAAQAKPKADDERIANGQGPD
jgi:hypothetical protein